MFVSLSVFLPTLRPFPVSLAGFLPRSSFSCGGTHFPRRLSTFFFDSPASHVSFSVGSYPASTNSCSCSVPVSYLRASALPRMILITAVVQYSSGAPLRGTPAVRLNCLFSGHTIDRSGENRACFFFGGPVRGSAQRNAWFWIF